MNTHSTQPTADTLVLGSIDTLITLRDSQLYTTSLQVAQAFGKRHDHLIEKIENLSCSPEFASTNFSGQAKKTPISNNAFRETKYYEMTKDGFMFLVMGFTGQKAAIIKEAYIKAFNTMYDMLYTLRDSVPTYSDADITNSHALNVHCNWIANAWKTSVGPAVKALNEQLYNNMRGHILVAADLAERNNLAATGQARLLQ